MHPSHRQTIRSTAVVIATMILGLLLVVSLPPFSGMRGTAGYLPLHMLLETIAVVIAALVFAVSWNAYSEKLPSNIVLIGCAFLGVSVLDFSHTLSFAGMPDFITPSDPEKAIDFWLAARLMAAIALLVAAVVPWRPFVSAATRYVLFAVVLTITVAMHWLILFHGETLPHTFVPGMGLTPFKIYAEYVIIALNLVAAFVLWDRMRKPQVFNAAALLGAVLAMALSEYCFTLYAQVTDTYNLLGHVYKFISYLFLYRAIFVMAVENPYRQLSDSQGQLQATLDALPDQLFELDLGGHIYDYRSQRDDLLPAHVKLRLDKNLAEIFPPDAVAVVKSALVEAHEKGWSTGKQFALSMPSGKLWFELSVARKPIVREGAPRFIALWRDIAERKYAETALADSRNLLRTVIDAAPVRIFWKDRELRYLGCNPTFAKDAGEESPSDVIGKDDYQLGWREQAELYRADDRHVMESGIPRLSYDEPQTTPDGKTIWLRTSKVPLRNAANEIIGVLGLYEDITEQKLTEERIQYLAHYDALTGLPNRTKVEEILKYVIGLAKRNNERIAVMFLDLDRFKDVNDTLGHNIGDLLLIELAARMRQTLREEDTVCRMGGDEFVVVLPGTDAKGAKQVAQKLLDVIAQPCKVEKSELNATVSVGIAMYPEDGIDMGTLFRNADAAMYRAKRECRNCYRFYTAEMQEHSARNLQLLNALRYALKYDQLQLVYQPQLSIHDGTLVGVEALLRWWHPDLGVVSPAEFIPIAEENGLILPFGEWVLRHAARQAKKWLDGGHPPLLMAVNLSATQFRHPDLPELVTRVLDEEGLPSEYLELELTESVAMHDPQRAIAVMDRLHERGIRMSIDDFGTGYSSLSYLKKFKVSKLKIDRSFVRDICSDSEDAAIVSAIISLARSLGLKTIAEGVETAEQLEFLREQRCDEIQGYYYSSPLPANEFEAYAWNNLDAAM